MVAANDNQPVRYGPWLPTKAMAVACGSKHYFTGNPCINGHVEPRHVSNYTCLECTRIRVAIWLEEHPETAMEMRKVALANQAADYAINPQKYAERSRRSRSINLDVYRERERKRDLDHPEERRARVRNRRARIRGNDGTHSAEDIELILKKQKFKCAECGISVKNKSVRHVDHVMPIALGGSNWPRNLQILCAKCNWKKGAKHPTEFAQMNGRLL